MFEIFAALALAAAGGLRFSLALFTLALVDLFFAPAGVLPEVLTQPAVLALLALWTIAEAIAVRTALGLRVVQALQFFSAPLAGAGLAFSFGPPGDWLAILVVAGTGAALATALQAVRAGVFFRRGHLSSPLQLLQEGLVLLLVLMATMAPQFAAVTVFALLWFALQQAYRWRRHFQAPNRFALN